MRVRVTQQTTQSGNMYIYNIHMGCDWSKFLQISQDCKDKHLHETSYNIQYIIFQHCVPGLASIILKYNALHYNYITQTMH